MNMTMRSLAAAALLCLVATPSLAAVCYITEFRALTPAEPTGAQIAKAPAIAEQTVAVGAEAKSAAFNNATRFIRLHCDAIASFKIGTSPTATTSSARTPADATEYFGVVPGDKISIILNN